ncbi:hypothetical protein PR202_ga07594 [Eleusine coracana subsp. coracana]|uniref:Uncharacterized protein n=1 Tax=Eleusine coracana subsp. coracana TaxID=191504 RepID=A0AAV5BYE2_ELECO|nr:hypothetical protein PR202_ga07594 [Eleusine coracana subsp. coracana]
MVSSGCHSVPSRSFVATSAVANGHPAARLLDSPDPRTSARRWRPATTLHLTQAGAATASQRARADNGAAGRPAVDKPPRIHAGVIGGCGRKRIEEER